MEQIPDAPWIREAERYGMPPYGDDPDYSEQAKLVSDCDRLLDQIVDNLLAAEDELPETELQDLVRDLIYRVEDIGCDIRRAARKIHQGKAE